MRITPLLRINLWNKSNGFNPNLRPNHGTFFIANHDITGNRYDLSAKQSIDAFTN